MTARVLVTFATKHGSTRGIARSIGGTLNSCGCEVVVLPAGVVRSVIGYDAVVVGSAVYHDQWLWDGRRFVRRMRGQLRSLPTWVFSSGPIGGTPAGDALVAQARGPDPAVPESLGACLRGLQLMGHATFAGKVDSRAVGMLERDIPRGDWRDFAQVRAWARQIAEQVRAVPRAGRLGVGRA